MDSNAEDLSNTLKEIDKKMSAFSSILEKFGLDIITKMGQTNLKITQLTDNVEELNKATIKIQGLSPQLINVIQNQKLLEDELNTIKSLMLNITSPLSRKTSVENTIERNESATDKKDSIIKELNDLITILENVDDPQAVKTILEPIKENIYEFTGGHKMLYEISQIITKLDSVNSLNNLIDEQDTSSETIRKVIIEKIPNWINKLMVRD